MYVQGNDLNTDEYVTYTERHRYKANTALYLGICMLQ
jgi:hypothetical protein